MMLCPMLPPPQQTAPQRQSRSIAARGPSLRATATIAARAAGASFPSMAPSNTCAAFSGAGSAASFSGLKIPG